MRLFAGFDLLFDTDWSRDFEGKKFNFVGWWLLNPHHVWLESEWIWLEVGSTTDAAANLILFLILVGLL